MISIGDPSGRVRRRNPITERCRNEAARATALAQARDLARHGRDEAATRAYLALLAADPADRDALVELGSLAAAANRLAAARTAFAEAVRHHPDDALAHTGLADRLAATDQEAARHHYRHALAVDPDCAEAHRGLARLLAEAGSHDEAEPHWRRAFPSPVVPPRGAPADAVPLLLLVSSRGGNVPTHHLIDRRRFAVTALYADLLDEAAPLPPHALLFNAIGDADYCPAAIVAAARIAARSTAPVINAPARVLPTGRESNARRLAAIDGLVIPCIERVTREATRRLAPPVLLRSPGYHTGRHFVRVETPADLAPSLAALPGEELLAIGCLDARGPDGLFRKYRVITVGGVLHPLHLAVSPDWKVHYMTAAMATDASLRAEEQHFLANPAAILGPRAMAALQGVARVLDLDYAGIDFALGPDGTVLFFEANATMVVNPPDPDPIWDYRRAAHEAVLRSVDRLLRGRL